MFQKTVLLLSPILFNDTLFFVHTKTYARKQIYYTVLQFPRIMYFELLLIIL